MFWLETCLTGWKYIVVLFNFFRWFVSLVKKLLQLKSTIVGYLISLLWFFWLIFYCWCFVCCRTNFLRLCVLQVTQQSQKHLEKIISIDEFVRRIYTVTHSNDPVARALTLRYVLTMSYFPVSAKDPSILDTCLWGVMSLLYLPISCILHYLPVTYFSSHLILRYLNLQT